MRKAGPHTLLFVLFTVSGFSGLIYESIWSHYLKLFLGHAAYAQTLVLTIFMGGLAVGSWLAGRYTLRWRNLLLGYAIAEGAIGLAGLVFHQAFDAGMSLTFTTILPAIGSPGAAQAFKWTAAALAIAPQSVLLGMTFPLMSGALIRRFPDESGGSIATLYFTNSLGAACGVLASGFALIPAVGLPGTILTAGMINLLLAAIVWLVARGPGWSAGAPAEVLPAQREAGAVGGVVRLLLVASFVTGAASFMYEIGWLRLLSLVLGASTHAFELMLSAFILGLALGSFWIRRRIQAVAEPLRFLGVVQVVMGILALGTLFAANTMFEFMGFVMHALDRSEQGYTAINFVSHAMALAIMLPATFCAGMTLPLTTHALLRVGYGERSIGQVYAANTVGAIVGVTAAVHFLLPVLGLEGLMLAGAGLDVGLGCVLLLRGGVSAARVGVALAGIAALIATGSFGRLDPKVVASGVYRHAQVDSIGDADVPYHRDGKTATVTLVAYAQNVLGLKTNGKTDATIRLVGEPPTVDEFTMVLLGAMPLAVRPQARTVAAIGFGSGLSTHVLLASPTVERVDTIEIEPFMYEASRAFLPRVERAYSDPRSQVRIEDARTWFATRGEQYDIIVSEPSHPWVSGVSSLYTVEFYGFARRHLSENGLFAQWLHSRALSPELLATVLGALGEVFGDYAVYDINGGDLMLLGSRSGGLELDPDALFDNPAMAEELERVRVRGEQDLRVRLLGTRALLHPYLDGYAMPVNSDYFPILDLRAVRSRYLVENSDDLLGIARAPYPIVEMVTGDTPSWTTTRLTASDQIPQVAAARQAMAVRDYLSAPPAMRDQHRLPGDIRDSVVLASLVWPRCGEDAEALWIASLVAVARITVSHLRPAELATIWAGLDASRCEPRWTDLQRRWVSLVEALSRRDAPAMAAVARELLARSGELDASQYEYVLGIAMLGEIASGRPAAARVPWLHHGPIIASQTEGELQVETLVLEALTRATP